MDEPKKKPSVCAFDGCEKSARARGYCQACYYRLRRQGELSIEQPPVRWIHRISNVNPEQRTGDCLSCGPGVRLISRGGNKWRCYEDSRLRAFKWKQASRQVRRSVLLDACEICGGADDLKWDHDHSSSEFRGTLCNRCNLGLGLFKDNPESLRAAIRYLSRHKTKMDTTTPP